MSKKTIAITPDTSLMEKIGATNFTLAEAVVELVANSLDARRHEANQDPIPVRVDVTVDPKQVVVVDDASGMTEEVLASALTLGVQMDKVLGKRKRKGMYGLGLKTAAASIGRTWAVHTRPMNQNVEYMVEFNLQEYAEKGEWTIDIFSRKPSADTPLGARKSGTAVVVTALRDANPSPGAVLDLLGEAYKPHISEGDVLTVNGQEARAVEPDLADRTVEFDVEVKPGWRVRGRVAVDKKTHNDGCYGFNLYRENQLIVTWDKSWIPAHLMTSRIVGEAHLDYMPVNFNKQGFKRQSPEWVLTTECMKEWLKPTVRASREASKGRSDDYKEKRAIEGMKRAYNVVAGGALSEAPIPEGPEPTCGTSTESGGVAPASAPVDQVTHEHLFVNGKTVVPTFEAVDYGSEITPWDYLFSEFDGGARIEVKAVLNTCSSLFEKSNDHEMLGVLAQADCVTRCLMEQLGVPSQEARALRDRWIHLAIMASKAKKGQDNGK
jgi:Histidine kinase-, DNA gyrase B-, and HSP90-like ATPase